MMCWSSHHQSHTQVLCVSVCVWSLTHIHTHTYIYIHTLKNTLNKWVHVVKQEHVNRLIKTHNSVLMSIITLIHSSIHITHTTLTLSSTHTHLHTSTQINIHINLCLKVCQHSCVYTTHTHKHHECATYDMWNLKHIYNAPRHT